MSSDLVFRQLKMDEGFNPLSINKNAFFTQARFYGKWQEALGRKVYRFVLRRAEEALMYLQLVKYPLPFGKSYFYCPYAPAYKELTEEIIDFLRQELFGFVQKESAVFIRLDFDPPVSEAEKKLLDKFFTKAKQTTYHGAYFQPRAEWLLPLFGRSEAELFSGMHKNHRYSIKFAEKNSVETEVINEKFQVYFEDFYYLLSQTATRNKFSLHPRAYYQAIFDSLGKDTSGFLILARHGEKILVINLVILFGNTATHLFGGSADEGRNFLASYAAQWRGIKEAKKQGFEFYNFGGVSIPAYQEKGWAGLSAFKQKFGGKLFRHSPFYDLVSSAGWYFLYNCRKALKNL